MGSENSIDGTRNWDQNPRLGPGSPGDRVAVHRDLLSGLGGHPTCRCALFLVKRRAARRASPILQATRRADPPSTAHLGTGELPAGRVAQLPATSDRDHRLTPVAAVPTVSRPAFRSSSVETAQ